MPIGSGGGFERRRAVVMLVIRALAVRAAGAAGPGTSAECLVNDGLDGARASAALGAAAKATINLFRISRQIRSRTHGIADIVVTQDVAGTDDHETGRAFG